MWSTAMMHCQKLFLVALLEATELLRTFALLIAFALLVVKDAMLILSLAYS